MAFRFKLEEGLAEAVRRIGREQTERAETELTANPEKPEVIHGVRKSLKRVRALLRLVRSGLGETTFKAENGRYRDIGRLLAGERDRHVMLTTVSALEARHGLDRKLVTRLQSAISARTPAGQTNGAAHPGEHVSSAIKQLAEARRSFRKLAIQPDDMSVVVDGLERGMRSCRKTFQAAYVAETDEAFHEWRKTVQHHWRHMMLLSRAWPELMVARAHESRELSQLIGEDHDHGVLAAYVLDPGTEIDRKAARDIAKLCRKRQATIRSHARPLGERLLAEGAEGLARRVGVYWAAARSAERSAPLLGQGGEALAAEPRKKGTRQAAARL